MLILPHETNENSNKDETNADSKEDLISVIYLFSPKTIRNEKLNFRSGKTNPRFYYFDFIIYVF